MHKVKCINGHFYNRDRFETCPICGCGEILEESGAREASGETFRTEPLLPEEECDRSDSDAVKRSPAWVDELAPTEILCAEEEIPAQKMAAKRPPQQEQTPTAETDPAIKGEPAVQKAASGLSEAIAATASKKNIGTAENRWIL